MSGTLRVQGSGGCTTRWSERVAASYRRAGHWRGETPCDVARRAAAPDRPLLEGARCLTRVQAWDAALAAHPAVADVAIVALPSRSTGEQGCAFVVLQPGRVIDLAEIGRFLAGAGLARQKFPEHLVVVDDLPRVPSGKIRKDVLRARAREIAR